MTSEIPSDILDNLDLTPGSWKVDDEKSAVLTKTQNGTDLDATGKFAQLQDDASNITGNF